ncbi:MAG TPA: DUF2252 family protein [Nannocystaceae bacterium]|nr:DUF2252 family protein [Nannocystaceae bacterium]
MYTSACAVADDERSAWLRHTLVLDNQDFLERDVELAAGKLAKMGETPFGYFRGSAAQMMRDMLEPGGAAVQPCRFTDTEVEDVALVGDPHPENLGGYRTGDGTITIDFNDFDAASYGPFELDVRRLAVGFWIAGAQVGLGDGERSTIVAAVARGYADEIAALAEDPANATIVTDAVSQGVILDALLLDAREDGDDAKPLDDYTIVDGDARHFLDGELEPTRMLTYGDTKQLVFEDTLQAVDAGTAMRVRALIDAWRTTVADPSAIAASPVISVARRLGAGVSSYPLYRWYVLLEGPSDGPDDDVMLELKEVRDPPPLPGLRRPIDAPYPKNGQRVVMLARELQAFVDDDPLMGWAEDGAQSFRVRERSGYQNSVDLEDLEEAIAAGEWTVGDVEQFAGTGGRVLARSHSRARRARGTIAGAAIAHAIDDADAFIDDVVAFAEHYGPVVQDDRDRLAQLVAEHGADLGYGSW